MPFSTAPPGEDGSQKWVDFAASFWHVDCVRSMSRTAFSERYRKWCKRHCYNFNAARVGKIYDEAKNLIAMLPKDALTKILVQEAITQLNAVSRTVEVFRAEMNHFAQQLLEYPVVMSLYGIGDSLGPQLMGRDRRRKPFCSQGLSNCVCGC